MDAARALFIAAFGAAFFLAPPFLTTFLAITFFLAGAFLALVTVFFLVAFLALVGMAHILPLAWRVRKITDRE